MTKRIKWIDIAKGITILLVIVGHSIGDTSLGSIIRGLIFSFHMPLFFILGAMSHQCPTNIEQYRLKMQKSMLRLIVPAMVLFCINAVPHFFTAQSSLSTYWKDCLLTLLYSSGVTVYTVNHIVKPVGIIWFFFVMFSARAIYDIIAVYLRPSLLLHSVILISVLGVCLGYTQYLPFSFDISMAILPFFFMGDKMKKCDWDKLRKIWSFPIIIIWLSSFSLLYFTRDSYLELAKRHYTLYPICFACAFVGTLAISFFSQYISKHGAISEVFSFIGRNSLYLLCIHVLDNYYSFAWDLTQNEFINSTLRVAIDVYIVTIIVFLKERIRKKVITS